MSNQKTSTPAASANTFITFYGFDDNNDGTGPSGSAVIAYPKSDGNLTLHDLATEGQGTYDDPITFAADPKDLKGAFPIGSRIYVPYLQKYFIMEDECDTCDQKLPKGTQYGINIWMGPQSASLASALTTCEDSLQRMTNIILKPAANLLVDTTPLFQNGQCTSHTH